MKDRQYNGQKKKDTHRSTKLYTENKISNNTNPDQCESNIVLRGHRSGHHNTELKKVKHTIRHREQHKSL